MLPWANLDSPTGSGRDTGLTLSLLSIDAPPHRTSSVKRSDVSGVKRRAVTTSRSPRSPRQTTSKAKPGNAAAAAGPRREAPTHVTAEGLVAMQAELQRLKTVERPQVVERVKNARELGDLRENADYEAARNEQSFLEGRILELEQRIRTAAVFESGSGGAISMGSTVVYEVDGVRDQLSIVGSTESDPGSGTDQRRLPGGQSPVGSPPGRRCHHRHTGGEDPLSDRGGQVVGRSGPTADGGEPVPGRAVSSSRPCP